jgi:large subunit ribosomal protein L30
MSRLRLTQVRSVIDRPKDQKDTVRRLGLHRIHDSVVKDDRPEIRGMVEKVRHLVKIEELGSGTGDAGKDAKRPRPTGAGKDPKRPGSGVAGKDAKRPGSGVERA